MLTVLDAGMPAPARGLFTTRVGGVGDSAGAGTNLTWRGDPRCSLANRDLLARALAVAELGFAEQVHGARVAVLTGPASRPAGVPHVDALVTRTPGLGLVALAADCMPVLFADPVAGVVAAAHAGRPGLLAGVLPATVAGMVEQGAEAGRVVAVVGPCIGACCYELPDALVADCERRLPGVAARTRWGTRSIDLRTGAELSLAAVGIGDVRHVGGCTHDRPELFYSYRRDGTPDRHAGAVALGVGPGSGPGSQGASAP